MNNEDKPEVCEAVALILKRMDSNPEEFVDPQHDPFLPDNGRNRWAIVVQKYWAHLSQHEQNLLKEKKQRVIKEHFRNEFYKAVQKELLVGKEDPSEFKPMVYR